MSDNIPPDLIEQELNACVRIPTEVWTDIFKMLPRRVLVQIVSPVCYPFKEICNKNVKNIHVIKNVVKFNLKLMKNDPGANQQLEHLAGNSCQLAGQFRLKKKKLYIFDEKSQAILRHCTDLFIGFNIYLDFFGRFKNTTSLVDCLTHLEKPVQITVDQHIFNFWHHPTFKNCSRVHLRLRNYVFVNDFHKSIVTCMNIYDWLHHRPTEMDCDGNAADRQVRCMIVYLSGSNSFDWLLNRCSEKLQQSRGPADRRPYVLSFKFAYWLSDWPGFDQFHQSENKSTGEVLLLDRVMDNGNYPNPTYRLRRCLAEEEANGPQFYAGMFKRRNGDDTFKIEKKTPKVLIR